MKYIYSFLFAWIIGISAWAQSGEGYDPENPADPTVLYNLTMEASPRSGGSVNHSNMAATEGESIYCAAYPNTAYTFKQWMVGDSLVSTEQYFYFTMPAHSVVLTAYFEYIGNSEDPNNPDYNPENPNDPFIDGYYHTVTLYATPSVGGYFNSSSFLLREKEETDVYAYPRNGYRFASWKKDGKIISTTNPLRVKMETENVEYTATFVYNPENPENPGTNSFNAATGELVIDQFEPGYLNSTIYNTIGSNENYSLVQSIVIVGQMNSEDFGFSYNMHNCSFIDLSRTSGYTQIPSWSFENMTSLTKIILPSTVEYIGHYAFSGCNNLSELICYANVPPTLDYAVFDDSLTGLIVRVPSVALSLYKEAEGWKNYTILPLDEETYQLNVSLPTDANDGRYKNMTLELYNISSKQILRYIITDRTTYTFTNLISDTKYNVSVKNKANVILGSILDIEIVDKDIDVAFDTLLQPQNIEIKVITPDDKDVTKDVIITWFDEEGNYISKGTVLKGIIEGSKIGYAIELSEKLAMQYLAPSNTNYEVANSNNNLTLQLVPFEEITINGTVKDSETGKDIRNAKITISQTLNNKYSKSVVATTKHGGVFDAKIYNTACTIIVTAKDYATKEIVVEDVKTTEELDNILLESLNGYKIKTTLTYTYSVADGEKAEVNNNYTDYTNIAYSIYNKTKEKEITDFQVQYPYIVLRETIDKEEQLSIRAYSKNNSFNDVTVDCTVKGKEQVHVKIHIVELGKLKATYTNSDAEKVIGVLYNNNGEMLQKSHYTDSSVTFDNLADGEYTLVTMAHSNFFNSIAKLNDLINAGLAENTHFIKNDITVESGKITIVNIANIPHFDDSNFYYTSNNTLFSANKQSVTVGNYITLRAKIDFNAKYSNQISNVKLIFDLPDNCDFVDNSILTGNDVSSYYITDRKIEVELTNVQDVVRFCVIPTEKGTYKPSAFVQFTYKNQEILQPIGTAIFEAELMKINVPQITSQKAVVVTGVATADSEIRIYDNGVLVGSTHSLANGNWSAKIELYKPYSKTVHTIHAEIKTLDNQTFITESKRLEYDKNYTSLSKITMIYNGNKIVFDQIERTTTPNSYSYVPSASDFTFIAEFTNTDTALIKNLEFIILASDKTTRRVTAEYNEAKRIWFAKTQYNNSNKLPINVKVNYIGIQETPIYDEDMDIDFDAMYNELINDMHNAYKGGSISILINTLNELLFSIIPEGYTDPEYFHIIKENYNDMQSEYAQLAHTHIMNDSLDFEFMQEFFDMSYNVHFWDNKTKEAFTFSYTGTQSPDSTDTERTIAPMISAFAGIGLAIHEHYIQLPEIEYWYQILNLEEEKLEKYKQLLLNLLYEKCENGTLKIENKELFEACKLAITEWTASVQQYSNNFRELLDTEKSHIKHQCTLKGSLSVGLSAIGGVISGFTNMFAQSGSIALKFGGLSMTKSEAWIPEATTALNEIFGQMISHKHGNYLDMLKPKHNISNWYIEQHRIIINTYIDITKKIKSLYSYCEDASINDNSNIGKNNDDYPTPPVTPIIDPAGYVYEGVSSNRLEGVTASCYYKEFVEDLYGDVHENVILWDAAEYAQENPLFTDENGMYRWDVPQGSWQVKFEKEGYETTYSEWLPVPPPQLEVNIAMIQNKQPEIKSVHAYKNGIEIEFDKYMQPATLNTDNIFVIQNGEKVEGTIAMLNEEITYPGLKDTYVSKIRFQFESPIIAKEITLTVSNKVKSYADKQMQDTYTQTFDIEEEINTLDVKPIISMFYNDVHTLTVKATPATAVVGKVLVVKSTSEIIASVSNDSIIFNNEGEAEITIFGELPGTSIINYTIIGYEHTASTIVYVEQKNDYKVSTPKASIASGTTVEKGTMVVLSCATENATIYYTIDGSSPCDITEARKVYDDTPIVINESMTIKAMATAPDLEDSNVAEFVYTINSSIDNDMITLDNEIIIYPIPAKDILNIMISDNNIENITIYTLNGMITKSVDTNTNNIAINIEDLNKGVYIINITTKNGIYKRKFIK